MSDIDTQVLAQMVVGALVDQLRWGKHSLGETVFQMLIREERKAVALESIAESPGKVSNPARRQSI